MTSLSMGGLQADSPLCKLATVRSPLEQWTQGGRHREQSITDLFYVLHMLCKSWQIFHLAASAFKRKY